MKRRIVAAIILSMAAGCAATEEDLAEVAVSSAALASFVPLTPFSGSVTTCFLGEPDHDARRDVRFSIDSSWGAVIRLTFTGFQSCPASIPSDWMPIRLVYSSGEGGAAAPGRGARLADGENPRAQVKIYVTPTRAELHNYTVHEIGHAIGFVHEHQRRDAIRCPEQERWDESRPCGRNSDCSTNVCDTVVGLCTVVDHDTIPVARYRTPYDPNSVMNYCHDGSGVLTDWDIIGAQWTYGRRIDDIIPLYTQYSSFFEDHVPGVWTDPETMIAAHISAGYAMAYMDGWVFADQVPSGLRLDRYRNAERGDYVLVANQATRTRVESEGYFYNETLGFAYATKQPGTVPLVQYFHAGRGDFFATVEGSIGEQAAKDAKYDRLWTEAFVFKPGMPPYNITWRYYHSGRGDNVLSLGNGLAINLVNAGYGRRSLDLLTLKHNVSGTVRLNQYWSQSREDHFSSIGTVAPSGYALIGNAGFVFSNSANVPDAEPIELWWHSGRGDNFTTLEHRQLAINSDYVQGADQGQMFTIDGTL